MPTNTGVSTVGVQTLQSFQTLSVAQFALEFPDTPILPFERLGYFYVFAVQSTTPFQTRLLTRGAIYRPGVFSVFPANYGFTTARYTIQAKWNDPGINWRCLTT
jgi:hypothetical protein